MLFGVGLDHTISGGIAHTKQGQPLRHLIVIQKALISLINASFEDLASACAARTSSTGIGQINALLLGCIEDVLIIGATKAGSTLDADCERSHDSIRDQLLDNEV